MGVHVEVLTAEEAEDMGLAEAIAIVCTQHRGRITLPLKEAMPDHLLRALAGFYEPVNVSVRRDVIKERLPWTPTGGGLTIDVIVFEAGPAPVGMRRVR